MTGEEISGLVDKVAEKLGVASEQAVEAFQGLAAEYQTANIAVAVACGGVLLVVCLLSMFVRIGGKRMANLRGNQEWIEGTFVTSWVLTAITAIICFGVGAHHLYHALMPHVSLLARLGLLR